MDYEFPYNSDRQELSSVRVRSRLKKWEGEYLGLRDSFTVAPTKGSPWEGKIRIENKILIEGNKAAQFSVSIEGALTLSQFKTTRVA
jgi:hypothetical protein